MGKTLIPENFCISEEMRLWARYKVPSVNIDEQHELFLDYWRAHGKKMLDWVATWRNWMRRAPEFARPVNQYSQFARRPAPAHAIAPRQEVPRPIQPREHPLFKKHN